MAAGGTSGNPSDEFLKEYYRKETERNEEKVVYDPEFQRLINRMAQSSLERTIKVESGICDALIGLHKARRGP